MARQRAGLGRGLSSLMAVDELAEESAAADVQEDAQAGKQEGPATEKKTTTRKTSTRKTQAKRTSRKTAATQAAKSEEEPEEEAKATLSVDNSRVQAEDSFEVDIELLIANPDQPRSHFDVNELNELADSIQKNGLLQPILVRQIGALYQIIAGERRWQACKKIGMKRIPIRITEADDIRSIALAMIENIQRSDLNPMEEAYGYRMLMERNKMTQSQVAEAVSKARPTIANTLRLLDLPEDAQQLLYEGTITAGHARAILSIPTEDGRRTLTKRLVEQSITVREAENIARLLAGRKTDGSSRTPTPKQFKKVAKSLREVLGTNVRVKTVKGKNKIEIEFKDEEELEQIFRKMVPED